jgi:predicted ABC-type ATPase
MKIDARDRAVRLFRAHDGLLRTSEGLALGIHPRTLYALRDEGVILPVSRGIYRLADRPPADRPDMLAAALRVPKGVVCLASALAFHGMIDWEPSEVSLAIPRRMRTPALDRPPARFHRFDDASYRAGIERHTLDGVQLKVYGPEKTIADCLKFRNKVGPRAAAEAVRLCGAEGLSRSRLLKHARTCRVSRIMTPYLKGSTEETDLARNAALYHVLLARPGRVREPAAKYASARKRVLIIAGPNGAGKTTFAREFLPREAGCPAFVNADFLAGALSPFSPGAAAVRAGRLMLAEIDRHLRNGDSFAFETTLSGLRYARAVPRWQRRGYAVKIVFLRLSSEDAAVRRVAARARQGGHDIPEEVVRRRYRAGWRNFTEVYRQLVDTWLLYDNSGPRPVLLDHGGKG